MTVVRGLRRWFHRHRWIREFTVHSDRPTVEGRLARLLGVSVTDHADTIRERFPLLYECAQNAARRRELGLEVGQGDGEAESLLAERQQAIDARERAERRAALYETTLRNIADEHWNAGRGVPISLMEYAQATLNVAADSDAVNP